MITFHGEETISRPIDEVFRYATDPTKQHEWTDMTAVTLMTDGPTGVGTRYASRFTKGPIKDIAFEVTRYDAPRVMSYRSISKGPMYWEGDLRFESTGPSSTRVTSHGQVRLRGLWRLLEPLVAGEVRRGEAAELVKLKGILEGGR